jgi:hypothetical protein
VASLAGLEEKSHRPHKLRSAAWTGKDENYVLKARRKYPLWGKYKLSVIIEREMKIIIKPSTVGRILKKLTHKGHIKPVAFLMGKTVSKKKRIFDVHAKRLPTGMHALHPGELVQVDHMSVEIIDGIRFKHFAAVCPLTKIVVEQAYSTASSASAAEFLAYMLKCFPFQVKSLQVDGGSEFMRDFEKACKEKSIELFVLPPRSPELNGHVERSNGTAKYEFYQQYTGSAKLTAIRVGLEKFNTFYNKVRPHQGLNYLTPWQYYSGMRSEAPKSHIY